jgi:hypothetical protein
MNTQIQPLEIPLKGTATQLFIRTSTEGIYEPTGMIYWQLLTEEGSPLMDGNIHLSAEQVAEWGDSMEYIENLVIKELNVTKK